MEFDATADDRIELRGIPPLLGRLLREIPVAGNLDCPKVTERFFPAPSPDATEDGLRQDWKAFVEPGLHEAFSDARQVVEADLRGMTDGEDAANQDTVNLTIPRAHVMAWIHALNQARLALAAHHDLDLEDSTVRPPAIIATEEDWVLLQMGFYDQLLSWLIDLVED